MERRKKNTLNILISLILVVIAFWISFVLIFGKGGIIRRRRLESEISLLYDEIGRLEKDIEMADIHIQNLKSNRKYIEGFAHELGYKKEGEILFKFVEKRERDK